MGMISDSFRGFWVVSETAGYLAAPGGNLVA